MLLKKDELKAALISAANGDIRYYLNGVLLEKCPSGEVHIVSTDGHRLFVGKSSQSDSPGDCWSVIIPRDIVAAAVKSRGHFLVFEKLPDGRYTIGDSVFTPVGGKFPEWRRIRSSFDNGSHAEWQPGFNWRYLADAQEALRVWYGASSKAPFYTHFETHGIDPAMMTARDGLAYVIIMGMREGSHVKPFDAEAYQEPKPADEDGAAVDAAPDTPTEAQTQEV